MAHNIKDVAKQAGVSASTVSRVITSHPRISEQTRKRVFEAMKDLNYHPNANARSLVNQSSRAIGLLTPSSVEHYYMNPFFAEVLRGITDVVQQVNYDLFLSTSFQHLSEVQRFEQMMFSKRVDGVILMSARVSDPLLDFLQTQRYPVVLLGRPAGCDQISWVNNDNVAAAYDGTMHLLQLGHRRIGFISGATEFVVSADRLNGYLKALSEFAIAHDPNLIVAGDFMEEMGYSGMTRLLALVDRPTAVIASDDVLAFGAMQAAGELGYRIPEDLAIIGFNDIPLAKLSNPPMTTVNVHIFELGQAAARLMIEQLGDESFQPKGVQIDHELVIRRSCGAKVPVGYMK